MIRETTEEDIRHVVENMRAADAEEHFACRLSEDRALLARELILARTIAIKSYAICTDDGMPASILTAYLIGPRLGALHRVSTDRWPAVAREAFRFGTKVFVPCVLAPNLRRAECSILAKHRAAGLILRKLGFVEEGLRCRRGKNGEDYLDFAWLNAKVDIAGAGLGSPPSIQSAGEVG